MAAENQVGWINQGTFPYTNFIRTATLLEFPSVVNLGSSSHYVGRFESLQSPSVDKN